MTTLSEAQLLFGYELAAKDLDPEKFSEQLYDPATRFKPDLVYQSPLDGLGAKTLERIFTAAAELKEIKIISSIGVSKVSRNP